MEASESYGAMRIQLENAYQEAEKIAKGGIDNRPQNNPAIRVCEELAATNHAFRGAAITFVAYKLSCPEQDIRAHKSEYANGFSARGADNKVTVPFLLEKTLQHSVESHWLTQTISYAPVLTSDVVLKTQPKRSGPLLIEVVNLVEEVDEDIRRGMLVTLLLGLIKIRNASKIVLTRPKNLSINAIQILLDVHFTGRTYSKNAPRLPQLAIYAIYQAMMSKVERFAGQSLQPIARMKAADRKAGTVGDIVVTSGSLPWEAVEVKFKQPITLVHVAEAIEKVRAASVSRYYLLSTAGILDSDLSSIRTRQAEFLKHNGCEIIVNGVLESIAYYLRMLPNTTEFISNYAALVESDPDTDYEHRVFWNEVCETYI
jgi:DNA (cytosine-5)-methyltransferase 1